MLTKSLIETKALQKKTTASDRERLRSLKEYGNFIENTPFYQYPYFKDIGSYWSTYYSKNKCLGSRIKGALVGAGMTVEYALKGLISAPMSFFYGSEAIKEAETIHLLIQDPDHLIETLDPTIVVLKTYPDHDLKHIEVPRYMHFKEVMLKMATQPSLTCLNIAGHDKIQVDVKSSNSDIMTYKGAHKMYKIPAPTDSEHVYVALEVDVNQLFEVIRALENDQIDVLFIHDF